MERLLVSSISWSANQMFLCGIRQVFDVGQYNVSWLAIVLIVLAATNRGDMARNAGVDDKVLFSGMPLNG